MVRLAIDLVFKIYLRSKSSQYHKSIWLWELQEIPVEEKVMIVVVNISSVKQIDMSVEDSEQQILLVSWVQKLQIMIDCKGLRL